MVLSTIPVTGEPVVAAEGHILRVLASIGRLHITVIAALGMFTFGWLFTGEYMFLLTAVCALDWYLVNLMNRVVDFEEDRANAVIGTGFVNRNRGVLLRLWVVVLFVSFPVVHFLNPAITWLRIASHSLGALYNLPVLPGRRRLKQVYFWKNVASATGFMITLFGYPLATAGWGDAARGFPPGITWATVLFSGVFFFLFEVSYEVIYDLRDVKGDALADVRTYPVVHGEKVAINIVDGLIFFSMAVILVGYAIGFVPWRIFIMVLVPPFQLCFYKRAMARGISTGDCIRMTWIGAGFIVIYHLWVIAKLPGAGF